MEFWILIALIWVQLLTKSFAIKSVADRFYTNTFSKVSDDCALKLNRPYLPYSIPPPNPYELYNSDFSGSMKISQSICIRYEDVNKALAKAKKKLNYVNPAPTTLNAREIDRTANLIIETTKSLAKRFHLNFKEIYEALPTIDTSRTDIWDVCPDVFKPTPCTVSRFRLMDGRCNNIKNSLWGISNSPFVRFLSPVYGNGVDAPRVSYVDGSPLPNVREVSTFVHRDFNRPSDQQSTLLMSWGQFVDHDLTQGAVTRDEGGIEVTCCNKDPEAMDPNCMPIEVPGHDLFFSRFGVRCMDFLRNRAGQRPGCALGPRVHINLLTSAIDANFIYGSTDELARTLRLGSEGRMRTWDKFKNIGLKDLLPPMVETPERDCIGRPRNLFCFMAGDERVNEQLQLTILHTVFIREHNRMVDELSDLNPHWDDERLYQETRHIMAAIVQHIAYNEFLPLVLGPTYMARYNLTLQKKGYWHGYDEKAHMGPSNSFQTAAFRFGHTLIQGRVQTYDRNHEFIDSMDLRDLMRQPFIVYQPGMIDKLIGGLLNTPAQFFDPFMSSEVTDHLFQQPFHHFGLDLVSLNLMRAREHGVPGYNDYREWCGMKRIQTFEELAHYMNNGTAFKYSKLYKHPDDIDLWSAGVSERIIDGAMTGPTFACIIAYQFGQLKKGDRFWYENPGFPSSFTPAQLHQIRKVTQAKIICDNGDDIPTIQKWVMKLPDPVKNPRFRCSDLPSINLQHWIEDPAAHGNFIYSL